MGLVVVLLTYVTERHVLHSILLNKTHLYLRIGFYGLSSCPLLCYLSGLTQFLSSYLRSPCLFVSLVGIQPKFWVSCFFFCFSSAHCHVGFSNQHLHFSGYLIENVYSLTTTDCGASASYNPGRSLLDHMWVGIFLSRESWTDSLVLRVGVPCLSIVARRDLPCGSLIYLAWAIFIRFRFIRFHFCVAPVQIVPFVTRNYLSRICCVLI